MNSSRLILATHSSRQFFEARCTLNWLNRRFTKGRLDKLPDIKTIGGLEAAVPFDGALSIWRVEEKGDKALKFLGSYNPGNYKIQFAAFRGDNLLVYGSDRLEVLDHKLKLVKTISDPWMVGGHTVFVDEEGFAWVTAAPANAVLKVDVDKGKVVERITMPEIYGKGYKLSPADNMRKHYIPTDLQPTHLNCAVPFDAGVMVTLWIPGAVGVFNSQREYREIISGFTGCHGGRIDRDTGELFITDSPMGIVWFFDPKTGEVKSRTQVESKWLHDADQVDKDLFVAGRTDTNDLLLFNRRNGEILDSVNCSPFGLSVMFVNVSTASKKWVEAFEGASAPAAKKEAKRRLGEELAPPLDSANWSAEKSLRVNTGLYIRSDTPLTFEYMLRSKDFILAKGEYQLSMEALCKRGGIFAGILDLSCDKWLASVQLLSTVHDQFVTFSLKKNTAVKIIITACNTGAPGPVEAVVKSVSLRMALS